MILSSEVRLEGRFNTGHVQCFFTAHKQKNQKKYYFAPGILLFAGPRLSVI